MRNSFGSRQENRCLVYDLRIKDTIVITKAENQEELWNYKLYHMS